MVCICGEAEEGSLRIFESHQSENIIVHGPDRIHGMNDGDLVLGCLTVLHNQGALYQ